MMFKDSRHQALVLDNLNNLRSTESFCDVILSCDSVEFPAHRNVLAASSPYFMLMFTVEMSEAKEKTVEIRGVPPSTLECLVNFAYTGEVNYTAETLEDLLLGAEMLQFPSVKEAMSKEMEKEIKSENCLGMLNLAELYLCSRLEKRARFFALENFTAVSKEDEFLELSEEKLLELTTSDALNVRTEECVVEAIHRWYQHNPAERSISYPNVMKSVRFGTIQPLDLWRLIQTYPILREDPECVSCIEQVKWGHLIEDQRKLAAEFFVPRSIDMIFLLRYRLGSGTNLIAYSPELKKEFKFPAPPYGLFYFSAICTDGESLFLTGGLNQISVSGAWKFHPRTSWVQLQKMLGPRYGHQLEYLNGFLYAMGGRRLYNGASLKTVERFNPETQIWTNMSPLKHGVFKASSVAIDGYIYVFGMNNDTECFIQRYCPVMNEWTEIACDYRAQSPLSNALAVQFNSKIYVYVKHSKNGEYFKVKVFDEEGLYDNEISKNLEMIVHNIPRGVEVNGIIYFFQRYHGVIQSYDPLKKLWTEEGELHESGELTSFTHVKMDVKILDNLVYVE